jgi:O-antigen/teichoic acid export membrane protein
MRLALTALANNGANLIIGLLSAAFLGPQAFGQFAIAMLIASLIQSCALDWLRLAAARFYAPSHKRGHGSLRGSLDILFVITAMVITIVCIGISAFIPTGLPFDLLLMALAFALINGFFDYQLALLRARFRDLLFSRMVISKIILSVVLTLGLAYGLGNSLAPLIGLFSANVLHARLLAIAGR